MGGLRLRWIISKMHIDQSSELVDINWLRDIIHAAHFYEMFFTAFHSMSCNSYHRDICSCRILLNSLQNLKTVHFWKLHIQQNQIKFVFSKALDSFYPVFGLGYTISIEFQKVQNQFHIHGIIFNNQYFFIVKPLQH